MVTPIPTDAEILALFKENEEAAFRLLFNRYYMPLCVYCMQLTGNFEQSEDLSIEQLTGAEVEIPEEEYTEEEYRLRLEQLEAALNELSKQEYCAIKNMILENRRYKETAELMGISVNTLKTYLSRGLKHLRDKNKLYLLF